MRQNLEPKQTIRNPEQTLLRHQVNEHGWPGGPIPSDGKGYLPKGWPTMANKLREDVEKWNDSRFGMRPYKGTSMRVEADMLVLDIDVALPEVMKILLDRLWTRWPHWFGNALERNSGAVKVAFFGRISEAITATRTHKYGGGHMVEVHAGKTVRQMVIHGPHSSYDETGRVYDWVDGLAPWNTDYASMPVFPVEEIGDLVDLCDAVLGELLPRDVKSGPAEAEVVYDLEPDMQFIKTDGEQTTVGEVAESIEPGEDIRGILGDYAEWTASQAKNHHGCMLSPNNRFYIRDFQDGVTHYFKTDAPPPPFELDEETKEAIAAMVSEINAETPAGRKPRSPNLSDIPRSPPRDDDKSANDAAIRSCANAVAVLLKYVAYWGGALKGKGGVLSIYPDGEIQNPWTLASLHQRLSNYSYLQTGAKGGSVKVINPVSIWMAQADRISVGGPRMRPELPCPMFDEDGHPYINRYAPPDHPTSGGTIQPLVDRLAALIPDPAECEWFVNWLRSKVQHPEWRMIGVVMIAHEAGSGRGLLAEFLGKLFGQKYVAPLPYRQLTGGDGSRFTADYCDKLIVYVNEAKAADDNRYQKRHAANEALKDFMEPNHRIPARIEGKGVDAIYSLVAMSTLVFTNNTDGLPISEGDRRAAVLMNGPQMTVAERKAFMAWMEVPENIGAAFRWLRDSAIEQDQTVFDAYMSPHFQGRDVMIDAGKTDIDRAYEAALEILAAASEVYTLTQVTTLTMSMVRQTSANLEELVRKHARVKGIRAFEKKDGRNWKVRFGEGYNGDNREPIYVHKATHKKRWDTADPKDIRRVLADSQKAVDDKLKEQYPPLRTIPGGKT